MRQIVLLGLANFSMCFALTLEELQHSLWQTPIPLKPSQWEEVFEMASEKIYPKGRLTAEQASQLLEGDDFRWRRRLLEWLSENAPEEQVKSVEDLLLRVMKKEGSTMVQEHAVMLLGKSQYHNPEVRKTLHSILKSESSSPQVREQALRSLGAQWLSMSDGAPKTKLLNTILNYSSEMPLGLDLASVETIAVLASHDVRARQALEEIAVGTQESSTDAKEQAKGFLEELQKQGKFQSPSSCAKIFQLLAAMKY